MEGAHQQQKKEKGSTRWEPIHVLHVNKRQRKKENERKKIAQRNTP